MSNDPFGLPLRENDDGNKLDLALLESLFYNEMVKMDSIEGGFEQNENPADTNVRLAPATCTSIETQALQLQESGVVKNQTTTVANPLSAPNQTTFTGSSADYQQSGAQIQPQHASLNQAPINHVTHQAPSHSQVQTQNSQGEPQQQQYQQQHYQSKQVVYNGQIRNCNTYPAPLTHPGNGASNSVPTNGEHSSFAQPLHHSAQTVPIQTQVPVVAVHQPQPQPQPQQNPQIQAITNAASYNTTTRPIPIQTGNQSHAIAAHSQPTMYQHYQQPQQQQQPAVISQQTQPISHQPDIANLMSSSISQTQVGGTAVLNPSPPESSTTLSSNLSQTNLVTQFQTLASRLGISLPSHVMQGLTQLGSWKENGDDTKLGNVTLPSLHEDKKITDDESKTSLLKQLEDTAEAAIASVHKRKTHLSEESEGEASQPNKAARRKKKPRKEDCEVKLAKLKAENDMLKRHLDNITNKSARFEKERKAVEQKMKDLVSPENLKTERNEKDRKERNKELQNILKQFTETYSDYGKHRQDELKFHLNQLERLAAPNTFTKMSLWTLGQKEAFFTNPDAHPISGILRKELEITGAQGRKIIAQRARVQRLCSDIKSGLELIAQLKSICSYKQKVFNDRMSKCQEILSPEQVVKLLVWIDDNGTVLESVCPGWGSQRIAKGN